MSLLPRLTIGEDCRYAQVYDGNDGCVIVQTVQGRLSLRIGKQLPMFGLVECMSSRKSANVGHIVARRVALKSIPLQAGDCVRVSFAVLQIRDNTTIRAPGVELAVPMRAH